MDNEDLIYPNKFKTSVYLKNIIKVKNVIVGDYSYYDVPNSNPLDFEKIIFYLIMKYLVTN